MSHKLSSQEDITNFPAPIKAIFKMSHKLWEDDQILETSQDLETFEQTVLELTTQLQAVLVEHKIQKSLDSEQVIDDSRKLAKNLPCKVTNKGFRDVVITTKSGICILVHTLYYIGKKKGVAGRKNETRAFTQVFYYLEYMIIALQV